ncbi:MAG: sulfite exporter TauE/SafE family protein [Proteobacteria bacterium]|nr:sulfite exporter TauE/SafE family protein [Pseudomonadota bacterium]
MVPLTSTETILVFLVITVGSLIQSSVGFGLGLIAVPVLLLINPAMVPGPVLIVILLLSTLMTIRHRQSFRLSELGFAVIGRFPGAISGVAMLTVVPEDKLTIVLGAIILVAVAFSLAGARFHPTQLNLFIAGILSGFMGTTSSIGGPPMALVYQNSSGSRLRGTLAGFFVLGIMISLGVLFAGGKLGRQELLLAIFMSPGIFVGFFASLWISKFMDQKYIRPSVLLISSLSAVFVILKSL